jgi:hypothetical protein
VASRANANASGNTRRRRVHGWYGAVYYGDKEDYASKRAHVNVGSGTCKKSSSQPGTKAGITSGGVAARRRGASAFLLGSMAGVSTRGKQRSSSPLWLLAEVQCVGVVRRCGLPARRKKRQVAARRRGRRGSRGSRRSWRRRVRLLPQAAPVFAANGSPTGGSTPPPSLLHSLLLRRVGVGGQGGNSPGAARVGSSPGARRRLK